MAPSRNDLKKLADMDKLNALLAPTPAPRRPFSAPQLLGASFWLSIGFLALALMLSTDAKLLPAECGMAVTYVVVAAPTFALGTLVGWKTSDLLVSTGLWLFVLMLFL
jgi:hypothetical protein